MAEGDGEGLLTNDSNIRDLETGELLDWGEVFFILHKHCHLNKWEIWDYTLPQITELIKKANRYIQFEVETRLTPLSIFGSSIKEDVSIDEKTNREDDEYTIATEDDVMEFARLLGGM